MGVPGFYSWLIKRYPLVKHMIDKQELPEIDYLYLDMNGIIYKCVKDDSIIFKSQILPKEMEQIWLEVFNYINMIVNILKPKKMIVMGLDGVAPRSKMNNQRSRRFKSARDHKKFMEQFYGFSGQSDSQENFKNNSISPGTKFMEELNANINFFIQKKIEQDDYWKSLSVIFTGSDSPGEGEHKIMEFIRANMAQFDPEDSHCLYGADADLIMLSMTLPLKNLCIIREEYVHGSDKVRIVASKKQKNIKFEMIFVSILREYFQIEYSPLKESMKIEFDIGRVIADFVFLFFFIGNDFLPRCMAYNIRESSIQDLIVAFKDFLQVTDDYVVSPQKLNIKSMALLAKYIAQYQAKFIEEKESDMQKYLSKQKSEFQSELQGKMKSKMTKEHQFLNELKTLYLNQDGSARSKFYETKFNVDPITQTDQFYSILNYYLYGLQFVYEYYFINLPSWQWYYPYYYAPLVSDLSLYLDYLASTNFQFERIEAGQPFDPFKQLLCILPKESVELLPEPFHQIISDKKSILRSPYDYYPDQFEDDPYGSIRSHQYISLIPFLPQQLLNEVYNSVISKVKEHDLRRNKFSKSILYEFSENASEVLIQSNFSAIPTVSCTIKEEYVDLKSSIKWMTQMKKKMVEEECEQPNKEQSQVKFFKMPSLKIKRFKTAESASKYRKSFVVIMDQQEEQEEKGQKFKLGAQVFYGYPLEHSGQIQAILTFTKFQYKDSFDGYNYELDYASKDFLDAKIIKNRCREAFDYASTEIRKKQRHEIDWKNTKKLIFLKDTMQYIRCLNGSFSRVFSGDKNTTYTIVPAQLVSTQRTYVNTPDNITFRDLSQEFERGENVLVFPDGKNDSRSLQVLKGKVVGYVENKRVKVRITDKIKTIDQKTLEKFVHTRDMYFTLKFAAFLVETRSDILLTILDSINIILDRADLPPSIDIGLNFISRQQKKIVPNLVRINFDGAPNQTNPQKLFSKLEISLRGLELILEFKRKFPEVIHFIEERHQKLIDNQSQDGKINWREPITLASLYKNTDKQVNSLMSVYLWLIKKEETHMPLSSIYSKQVSAKNIRKLQEYFSSLQKEKNKSKKYSDPKIIEVDPNLIMSRRLAFYGKMYLSKGPNISTIRDQVICLRPQFFGEYGVIIGVDGDKYEVLFKKPSFGKGNLNGICDELWGGKFSQRQLFNFHTWPVQFRTRPAPNSKVKMIENIGWINHKENQILPKYKQKAINTFTDFDKLAEKKLIPDVVIEHAAKVKKVQKVEKISEQYTVVDNKSHTYQYKYDRGQSYIPKQYVQKIEKDKKYVEKPIEQTVEPQQIAVQDYEKQVIENKIEEQSTQIHPKVEEQEDKEEDGDEMFAS